MRVKQGKEEAWKHQVKINYDRYGKACIDYTRVWAELMEKRIDDGSKLEDIAKSTSHEADTDGITGFMYGYAVSILSKFWIYGEELRLWHNLDTQIGSEGKKANESGGVLNPALMIIDPKEEVNES